MHTPILTSNDCEGGGEVFRASPDTLETSNLSLSMTDDKSATHDPQTEFFKTPAFLTVSSQLHLEVAASSISRVYTLQPTFRAERSHTNRHLSEFWMLEAEIAFSDSLDTIIDVAEASIKHLCRQMEISNTLVAADRAAVLQEISSATLWPRLAYTEAVQLLNSRKEGSNLKWGQPLSTEDERWLAETVGGHLPVFVFDYPRAIKPFYMRENKSSTQMDTVACFDLLVPKVGELAGGSLREERIDELSAAVALHGLDPEQYRWYLELRR